MVQYYIVYILLLLILECIMYKICHFSKYFGWVIVTSQSCHMQCNAAC